MGSLVFGTPPGKAGGAGGGAGGLGGGLAGFTEHHSGQAEQDDDSYGTEKRTSTGDGHPARARGLAGKEAPPACRHFYPVLKR
eukprot:scaffold68299_cov35-Prasinocladus_malaysianus.AAC.1